MESIPLVLLAVIPLPAVLPLALVASRVNILVPPMVTPPAAALKLRLLISKSVSTVLVVRLVAAGVVVAKLTFVPTPGIEPKATLLVASVFQLAAVLHGLAPPTQKAAAGPAVAVAISTTKLLPLVVRFE